MTATSTSTHPLDAATPADPRPPRWSLQGLVGLVLIVGAWVLQRFVPEAAALGDYLLPIGAGLLGWAAPLPAPRPHIGQLGAGLAFGVLVGSSALALGGACVPRQITIPTADEIDYRRDQLCSLLDLLGVPEDLRDPICRPAIVPWPVIEGPRLQPQPSEVEVQSHSSEQLEVPQ